MRILLKISFANELPAKINQHYLQSCVYRLLRKAGFEDIHRNPYKYFCFSNLFTTNKDDNYNLIISSPRKSLIYALNGSIKSTKISLGDIPGVIHNTIIIKNTLSKVQKLVTSTPIVLSIHKSLFTTYNLKSSRDYLYWTNEMPLNAFWDQLHVNLIRKYNKFHNTNLPENINIFTSIKYKSFSLVPYKKGQVAGTNWEFDYTPTQENKKIVEFCVESGFGQKNTAGFGFINKIT